MEQRYLQPRLGFFNCFPPHIRGGNTSVQILYSTDTVIGLDHCVSPRKKREEQEQLLRHLHLPSHTQLLGSPRSCQQQLTYFSQTF